MSDFIDLTDFRMKFCFIVGMNVNDVVTGLRRLLPNFNIIPVPEGSSVTEDLRIDRIRVYYDPHTLEVTSPPVSG